MLSCCLIAAVATSSEASAAPGTESQNLKSVSYALPRTVIKVKANVKQVIFHAGPYAEYAESLLGIDASMQDKITSEITDISVSTYTEADQSQRYSIFLPDGNLPVYLNMTPFGLVSAKVSGNPSSKWMVRPSQDNSEIEAAACAQGVFYTTTFQGAEDLAKRIEDCRDMRYRILTGDTDATYSGEAMKATIDELTRMENECLKLFTGTKEVSTYTREFLIVPERGELEQSFILSGLGDDSIVMDVVAEPVAMPAVETTVYKGKEQIQEIWSSIPATCTVTFNYSVGGEIFSTRVSVYQMGKEISYQIK